MRSLFLRRGSRTAAAALPRLARVTSWSSAAELQQVGDGSAGDPAPEGNLDQEVPAVSLNLFRHCIICWTIFITKSAAHTVNCFYDICQ